MQVCIVGGKAEVLLRKVLLFCMVIVLFIPSCGGGIEPQVVKQLELAQRYLQELDYEQAIVEFSKVIELDEKAIDAYLGLAEAYKELGDVDAARAVLEQGYKETQDISIQDALEVVGIIQWKDPELEQHMRVYLGNMNGTIDVEAIKNIDKLVINGDSVTGLDGKSYSIDGTEVGTTAEVRNGQIESLDDLKYFTGLEYLWIHDNQIKDISALKYLKNLNYINLSHNQIENIEAIGELVNLESLYLVDNQIHDISILGNLKKLTCLSIGGNPIEDLSVIGTLTKLEDLGLWNLNMDNVEWLGELTNLKALNINNNRVTTIEPLSKLRRLEDLQVKENPLSDVRVLDDLPYLDEEVKMRIKNMYQ